MPYSRYGGAGPMDNRGPGQNVSLKKLANFPRFSCENVASQHDFANFFQFLARAKSLARWISRPIRIQWRPRVQHQHEPSRDADEQRRIRKHDEFGDFFDCADFAKQAWRNDHWGQSFSSRGSRLVWIRLCQWSVHGSKHPRRLSKGKCEQKISSVDNVILWSLDIFTLELSLFSTQLTLFFVY